MIPSSTARKYSTTSSLLISGVPFGGGKITRSALETRSSRPPASSIVASPLAMGARGYLDPASIRKTGWSAGSGSFFQYVATVLPATSR